MKWFFLALLAPALDTAINFIDKYIIEHRIKDSRSLPVYGSIVALGFGTMTWLAMGTPTATAHNALLLIAAGTIWLWGTAIYFHALARSQTSYIVALLQTTPIFVLLLSNIFFNERLITLQLVGFILVFGAVMGLSVDKIERKIKLDKPFWQILAANLLFAGAAILVNMTVDLESFVTIFVYQSWGLALGGLVLFLLSSRIRLAFRKTFHIAGKKTLSIVGFNELLAAISQAITYLAITLGPVALVSVLSGAQVFYAIIFGVSLTLLFPHIFHEDLAKKEMVTKIGFSIILFIGVWLIGKG